MTTATQARTGWYYELLLAKFQYTIAMSNRPPENSPSPFSVSVDQAAPPSASNSGNTALIVILAVIGVAILFCGGILAAIIIPAAGMAKTAAQRMERMNNVRQIGIGMHNYHASYKQLPLTIVTGSDGMSQLGWRIGISPFVEGISQWDTVALNADVNGRDLVAETPPLAFQAPNGAPGETNIFAIVSDESMFPPTPNTVVRFSDVVDGLPNTIMAVELPNRTTNWTSDTNLSPDEAYRAIQELGPSEVAHLLMADGAVVTVGPSLSREQFGAMVTKAGGEEIDYHGESSL